MSSLILVLIAVFIGNLLVRKMNLRDVIDGHGGIIPTLVNTAINTVGTLIVLMIAFALLPDMPTFLKAIIAIPLSIGSGALIEFAKDLYYGSAITNDDIGEQTLRGAAFATQKEIKALRKNSDGLLQFAGIPIDLHCEQKHFKFLGGTGTGKSTEIRKVINFVRNRGDRLIIADPDGGYLANFYDPSCDLILNPFDKRSALWDLFAEIKTPYDARMVADSLIAAGRPGDEWPEYARTFVAALLGQCKKKGLSVADFWNLAMCAPQEVLHEFLAGTQAAPYTEQSNARMLGSIRSVASTSLAALEYVKDAQGKALSIRDWMRTGTGSLFIPYQASQITSMRQLVSAWMRLGIIELMEMPEQDNRVWFSIDELDAIGRIDGLKDALARIRKYGGRALIGFQSIAQVRAIYGEEDASTIIENCGNTLILRCSASEDGGTSAFASDLIGEREKTQYTGGGKQIVMSKLVLPSEIERLPDLEGYAKVSMYPDWHQISLDVYQLPQVAERFIPRAYA